MRGIRLFFMFVVLAATQVPGTTIAAPTPSATATAEEPGDMELVSPSEAEGKPAGLGASVGRLHPALVHFPIVWLVSLAVIDFLGVGLRREFWARAGTITLVATLVSILPTATTGLLLAAHMNEDPSWNSLMVTHRTLNLSMASLVTIALLLRLARRNRLDGLWRAVYLGLVFVATGLVLVAAVFGGRMVYGPNYFPF